MISANILGIDDKTAMLIRSIVVTGSDLHGLTILGIDDKTAKLIRSIAVMSGDINELTIFLKQNIENIHTGHYIYFGIVCGAKSAAQTADIKFKSFLKCKQN